jgi:hypothetical protein
MSAFPNVSVRNVAGLNIPQHDAVAISYHGSTNNISTVIYKTGGSSGATVATLTFAHTPTQPPTSDDAKLASVTRS